MTKEVVSIDNITRYVKSLLDDIQSNIYMKALEFRKENTHYVDNWDDFISILDNEGGFIMAHWDGTAETEEKIKEETKATNRIFPLQQAEGEWKCILTGRPVRERALFGKAY